MKRPRRAVAVLGVLLAVAMPARAQDAVKAFYAGKTVSIVTPYPPGGSFDGYSRLTANFLGKYLPGNPTVIVQNKANVAGTIRSFSETMPDDGTMIGMFPETIAITELTDPVRQWDVRKLTYIGSLSDINDAFIIRRNAPAKTLEDFSHITTNVGCNSPASQNYTNPALLKNLLGYKFHIICGYSGNTAFPIAMLQGEIDMTVGAWNGWHDNAEIKNGNFKVVLQGGLKRAKGLANVPLMQELVKDPTQKQVIEFWNAGAAIGRALLVRQSVPPERIAALRAAFDKAMQDPALRAEAAKLDLDLNPSPGAAVQRISEGILQTPAPIVAKAMEAIKQ